ncbi:MAG: pilus assembly protein TadG-related protein [Thermoguttaceae bacterium]
MSAQASARRRWPLGKNPHFRSRKGAILVLSAFLMVFLMAIIAFAVDLGYIMNVQSELKRATDAAALAGAGALVDGTDKAEIQAFEYIARNPAGGKSYAAKDKDGNTVTVADATWCDYLPSLLSQNRNNFVVQWGHWDPDTRTFTQSNDLPSTLRVVASQNDTPLFFARILGHNSFDAQSESIARFQPRDIVLVLDFSRSMNFDSQLLRINEYGEDSRAAVETNLREIYEDLGSPAYGSLQFTPEFLTVVGAAPTNGSMPQITVTFRSSDVYVVSTKDLSNVVLGFSNGATQKFEGLSGKTGTFRGTGSNASKRIDKVWVKSGSNASGEGPGYGERFEDTTTVIKRVFGLSNLPYPYPVGSWDEYINYVKSDSDVNATGYRKKYGLLTMINYWLDSRAGNWETPDLWKARVQPITAVKDSVTVFLDYIQEVDCDDRVGLAIYNSPNATALVEQTLTHDLPVVGDTVKHRQAGHYNYSTNIGAGLEKGIQELDAHARKGAFKMIVLMTDGNANVPYSESYARSYALQQAQLAASKGYPIATISLGCDADTGLMQEVADATKSVHFNIPGTAQVQNYSAQLREIFHKIAKDRPLALVK